jgi:hypothetical protein
MRAGMSTPPSSAAAARTGRPRAAIAADWALALVALALLVQCLWLVGHGRYNIDEGMHVNAGRLLFEEGALLYRDFPFSQGPGGPYFYGVAGALAEPSLRTARAASSVLCLTGLGVLAWYTRRLAGPRAALVLLLFTVTSLPTLWVFTTVRTEPGAVALTALAAVAFLLRGGGPLRQALAPCLLVWATAFRLTHVIVLLFVCGVIAWELRGTPRKLAATAGLVAVNGALAALPMLAFPGESLFHVLTSQLGRAERLGWSEFPFSHRFVFFRVPESGFHGLLLLVLPAWLIARRARSRALDGASGRDDCAVAVGWLLALAALTYLPLLVFRVGFASYFVNASLLFTAAIAISAARLASELRLGAFVWAGAALVWLGTAGVAVQTVETIADTGMPVRRHLEPVVKEFEALTKGDCTMLTFETHLAAELGCLAFPGLEYSRFSFFPELPDAEARRHGVLNRRLLRQRILEEPPDALALTREAAGTMWGRTPRRGKPLVPAGLRALYRPLRIVDVPTGPVMRFQERVHFLVRRDLAADPRYSM